MTTRRTVRWVLGTAVVISVGWYFMMPYVTSAAFVMDVAGQTSWIRDILPVRLRPVTSRDFTIPTRYGPLQVRLYQPDRTTRPPVIVMPGVHGGGIDEPRLNIFARRLATTGTTVLSVPLPDLREFRITTKSTDEVEDAAMWLSSQRELAPKGKIGIVGVSFAGGLALVAAGRPTLKDRLEVVVSLGGHADLPRTMTYLCTGKTSDGRTLAPHDYGVAIILIGMVEKLVPPDQAGPLRKAILTFLQASSEEASNSDRATALFADAANQAAHLAEPSRTLMAQVVARDAAGLGPKLLPFVEEEGGAASLSPGRSPITDVPVFLLHGLDDNIVPSSETPLMADYLTAKGNTRVRWLKTPLISHVSLQTSPALGDAWRLISFWKELLDAGR